jgi:hypothetical protein
LSEGRLRYKTVEKTKEGLVSKVIDRLGPTGLITTTTALQLDPENETRMVSLTVTDTPEQTKAVSKHSRRIKAGAGLPFRPLVAMKGNATERLPRNRFAC